MALEITVISCSMLPNVDGFLAGKSDPYVIVNIPGKKASTMKTATINNDLNPVWNHTGVLHGYVPGDSLEFQVWDNDTFPKPDQLIGKVVLTPEDFAANPYGMEGDLPLEDCKAHEATIAIKVLVLENEAEAQQSQQAQAQPVHQQAVQYQPQAVQHQPQAVQYQPQPVQYQPQTVQHQPQAVQYQPQAVQYQPQEVQYQYQPQGSIGKSKLVVEILNARDLPNLDAMLTKRTDPYVICQVPGGSRAASFQTPVISDNLNPEWNHVGEIPEFTDGQALEFQVWDKDMFPKPDQLCGSVVLSAEDFAANPHGLEGELPLTGKNGQPAGSLAIRVHIVPDDGAQTGMQTFPQSMHTFPPSVPSAPSMQPGTYINGPPAPAAPGTPYAGGILIEERWGPVVRCPPSYGQSSFGVPQQAYSVQTVVAAPSYGQQVYGQPVYSHPQAMSYQSMMAYQ